MRAAAGREKEQGMPYPELMIRPMRDELVALGFEELRSVEDVDTFMGNKEGSALLVVNSVCGCAAGQARPGVRMALAESVRPDRLATVFAGQDLEATKAARAHFAEIPPSSPSFALFKDGELVYFMPRHQIEGRSAEEVALNLAAAFERELGVAS
jgi:putative YphP/YqiW family bacilliredoxin